MTDKHATNGISALDSSLASSKGQDADQVVSQSGFIRRYRLPLFLAAVAFSLYAGSVLYVIFIRGQIT